MEFKKLCAGIYQAEYKGEKITIERLYSPDYGYSWHISGSEFFSEWNDFDPQDTLKAAKKAINWYKDYKQL